MFYAELIRGWAEARNLIKGSDVKSQFVKLIEEAGELANAIAKKNDIEFADAIGDMVVVLTIMAAQNGMMIEDCIDNAWQEIKDRKGKMVDGIFVKGCLMTPKEKNLAAIEAIAQEHKFTVDDILGTRKFKPLVKVRRKCVVMLREKGYSTTEIGRIMNRDHSTIVHSLQKSKAEA